jgi:hypothetical protein
LKERQTRSKSKERKPTGGISASHAPLLMERARRITKLYAIDIKHMKHENKSINYKLKK